MLCCGFGLSAIAASAGLRRMERTVIAPVATWYVTGHFGPELRHFMLAQYRRGRSRCPVGVDNCGRSALPISKRQVMWPADR